MKYYYINISNGCITEVENGYVRVIFTESFEYRASTMTCSWRSIPNARRGIIEPRFNILNKGISNWLHLIRIDLEQFISEHFEEFI